MILRLCSVFEPPDVALAGRGRRFDPIGGMQNHTAQLTRALDRQGVAQRVVTTRPPGAPRVARLGRYAEVRRVGLPLRFARQLYAPAAAIELVGAAASADVLHAHVGEDLAALPVAAAVARRHRLALVVTLHLSLRHTFLPSGLRSAAVKAIGARLEDWGIRRADQVIALTPRLRDLLVLSGASPGRVSVIPSGIAGEEWTGDAADPMPEVPHPRVVFVGRITRQKGIDALLQAAARLRTPGAQLVIVGDGPERRTLERAVRWRSLAGRVHVTGFRPHREVPAFIRHADVLVLPSVYEELGSVLIEAMSAGVPVVATDTGGIPDALGGAGVLVPPGDAAAVARAVDALLADPVRARELVALGRRRVRGYDWADLAGQVLAVYERAFGGRVRSPVPRGAAADRTDLTGTAIRA
jgi:glycogen synthase